MSDRFVSIIHRNKRKRADNDESTALCMAMEHVILVNGLECKMASNSSKVNEFYSCSHHFVILISCPLH